MTYKTIDLIQVGESECRASHLSVTPLSLQVSGNLPHSYRFAPSSINEARKLITWLNAWIVLMEQEQEENYKESPYNPLSPQEKRDLKREGGGQGMKIPDKIELVERHQQALEDWRQNELQLKTAREVLDSHTQRSFVLWDAVKGLAKLLREVK